ncbi:uncharacterized protein LOC62_03G003725 [Vanrija pseudolonga]|uniref:Uncharacterized protein n=1 Tax=Vanrija pseudolonga TaxID=143232 RepID=A0AAF0Y927_9TREE|nr:hypothetical protein LOC62_03G003725 [Vanrija pseudolonga]
MLICIPTVSTLLTLAGVITGPGDILSLLGFTAADIISGSAAAAISNYTFWGEGERDFSFTAPASAEGIRGCFTRQLGSAGHVVTDCKRARRFVADDYDDYYCICGAMCLVYDGRMLDCCSCAPEVVAPVFVFVQVNSAVYGGATGGLFAVAQSIGAAGLAGTTIGGAATSVLTGAGIIVGQNQDQDQDQD